jgi:hypothetical protein
MTEIEVYWIIYLLQGNDHAEANISQSLHIKCSYIVLPFLITNANLIVVFIEQMWYLYVIL